MKASALATVHPEFAAIDPNAVVARPDGCAVVDSRMLLASA
jgi:hypothetical protein